MMIVSAIVCEIKTQKLGKNSLTIVFGVNSSGIEHDATIVDVNKKLKLNIKSFLTRIIYLATKIKMKAIIKA